MRKKYEEIEDCIAEKFCIIYIYICISVTKVYYVIITSDFIFIIMNITLWFL